MSNWIILFNVLGGGSGMVTLAAVDEAHARIRFHTLFGQKYFTITTVTHQRPAT